MAKIVWTRTDEAPLLATYSFKPVVEAFASTANIDVETADISLAGRIIAQFPERLTDEQKMDDALAQLGELAKKPEANTIKLPNISASLVQLKNAIKELQEDGYDLPDYPDKPANAEEEEIRDRYDSVKGSAVNPGTAGCKELHEEAPTLHAGLASRFQVRCGHHGRQRLRAQREVRHHRR